LRTIAVSAVHVGEQRLVCGGFVKSVQPGRRKMGRHERLLPLGCTYNHDMHLRLSDLPAYAAHVAAREGSETSTELERLGREIREGDLCLSDIFVTLDPNTTRVTGIVRIVPIGEKECILTEWCGDEGVLTREVATKFLAAARGRATERTLSKMGTRISLEGMTSIYRSALRSAGFQFISRRIEYKTPIAQLPSSAPSRLEWRTMADVGEGCALDILRKASIATPDGANVEAGISAVADLLGGSYSSLDPRTVQLGHLHDRPISILLTQVDIDSGWSTFPFLGIIPEHRGSGLGTQIHLHGLATIRALGGTLYHDGTSESNVAMVRLFEKHGCIEYSRMEEWDWTT
ncbi:MAG: GNAT family N-acetyltransferase, partial [Lentisphaeria bacterium]|nr:GNAT family N-acetyltransferase [Lentisphaeria bacterium]